MYYPFLRGRQEELLALIATAEIISETNIVPIIEPVSLRSRKQIETFANSDAGFILITNPRQSELTPINIHTDFIQGFLADNDNYWVGYLISQTTTQIDIERFINKYSNEELVFVHLEEFRNPGWLVATFRAAENVGKNIFVDGRISANYQLQFSPLECERILLADSFLKQKRNADYPMGPQRFSNIHLNYRDGGYDGFGDFTIVGNHITTGGGQAHAVALHMTFLRPTGMNIQHFVSPTQDRSKNVAGKFEEAYNALCNFIRINRINTLGSTQYLALNGHFPGLGVPKRYSIMHHIETYSTIV